MNVLGRRGQENLERIRKRSVVLIDSVPVCMYNVHRYVLLIRKCGVR